MWYFSKFPNVIRRLPFLDMAHFMCGGIMQLFTHSYIEAEMKILTVASFYVEWHCQRRIVSRHTVAALAKVREIY